MNWLTDVIAFLALIAISGAFICFTANHEAGSATWLFGFVGAASSVAGGLMMLARTSRKKR